MRIMLLSASSVHTVRWANAFIQRGHEVHLVSQHAPIDGILRAVRLHPLPHIGGLGYLVNASRVASLVRELAPDVVNAHYATGYGTLARSVGKVPLVLNVWGSDVYDFPEKSALHRRWLLRSLRRADRVMSTSEAMAARTRAICPGLEHLDVVPFGVDTSIFHPRADRMDPPGEIIIGTVKTLAPKYGIDTLITAFARMQGLSGAPRTRLRIIGGGPQQVELERLSRSLNVSDRVEFIGPVVHDRVPDELRRMHIFTALSRSDSESFGVAVIEASACGLPVVVSNAGGLPEVVADGVTGAVVKRDDPDAAAKALAVLVASSQLRQQMGSAGVALVSQRYEWSVCVDRMMRVLEAAREQGPRA